MPSEVDICNQAIGRCGAKDYISSLADKDSENARLCNTFFDSVRDAVLRSHPWNCAIQRKTITALSDTPDSGCQKRKRLPSPGINIWDCAEADYYWNTGFIRASGHESSKTPIRIKIFPFLSPF
ncbi:hypothetical protein IIB79_05245 [candidate division KSB1 bacterium]|nr:hypothetical protein [candidate division KSB1 bacterium]